MKRAKILIVGLLPFMMVILTVTGCQKEARDSKFITTNVQTFLQDVFENKYRYVTDIPDAEAEAIRTNILSAYDDEELFEKSMEEITYTRTVRSKSEMKYRSAAVQVDVISATKNESMVTVQARVFYVLPTTAIDEDTNEAIVTKGFNVYEIELIEGDDSFVITSEEKVELTNASGAIIKFINEHPVDLAVNWRAYSGTTASTWAINHWNSVPTSGYYDYTNSNGDCTNFVSHCLKQGGWLQVAAWHWFSNGTSCDYNMTTCKRSPSWTGAKQFNAYISGVGSGRVTSKFTGLTLPWFWWDNSQLNTVKVLIKGDVAQLSYSGTYGHTMIVTSKATTSPYIYLTYRNATGYSPVLNKPVDELKNSFPSSSIKMAGYYVKP